MEKQNDSPKGSQEWFIDSADQEEFFPPSGGPREAKPHNARAGKELNGRAESTELCAEPVVDHLINEGSVESTVAAMPARIAASEDEKTTPRFSGQEIGEVSGIPEAPDPTRPNVLTADVTSGLSLPSSPKPRGFSQSDVPRLGGNAPRQPDDRAGFLVIVCTPQRVRLGQIVNLRNSRNTLGRGCRLGGLADDPGAAEIHAAITFESDSGELGFFLYTNYTAPVMVNGKKAGARTPLGNSDRITIASTQLVFFEALFSGSMD